MPCLIPRSALVMPLSRPLESRVGTNARPAGFRSLGHRPPVQRARKTSNLGILFYRVYDSCFTAASFFLFPFFFLCVYNVFGVWVPFKTCSGVLWRYFLAFVIQYSVNLLSLSIIYEQVACGNVTDPANILDSLPSFFVGIFCLWVDASLFFFFFRLYILQSLIPWPQVGQVGISMFKSATKNAGTSRRLLFRPACRQDNSFFQCFFFFFASIAMILLQLAYHYCYVGRWKQHISVKL